MVRRFTRDDGVSGLNLAKSSAARAVRGKIADQFPFLTDNEILDELIPKKAAVYIAKWCAEAALRGGCRSLLSVIRKHQPLPASDAARGATMQPKSHPTGGDRLSAAVLRRP